MEVEREQRSKAVSRIMAELACSTVIVEGKHDVDALASLGIAAITEGSIARNNINGRVCLLMDNDRRGIQRRERLYNKLLEMDKGIQIDVASGERLQKMLNITSIEQLCKPVREATSICIPLSISRSLL